MSAVVLQVGQCGNQLGFEWWRLLTKTSKHHRKRCSFSSRSGNLAAVCVDTEPKVLRGASKFVKNNEFRVSNIIEGKGGRGGNWAYGYHGGSSEGETGVLQRTMEAVRQEAERQDYYGGTILLHSLSGGTGSGLGSRLCEQIREEFPVGHVLTASVVPHQSGESPLQHYNTALSLASLYRSADGVLLLHNDHALSQCAGSPERSSTRPQGSLSAVNTRHASHLAGLLLPVQSLATLGLGMEPWELIRSVCPVPSAKLLSSTQASSRERSHWDSLISGTLQYLPQLSPAGKPYSSRAVLAVARGDHDNSFGTSSIIQRLKHRCVKWNPFPVDYWTDPLNELGVAGSSRLLTLCSNHSSVTELFGRVVQRAGDMLHARAYLHWYQRYGVEPEEIQQALNTLSDIVQEYDSQ